MLIVFVFLQVKGYLAKHKLSIKEKNLSGLLPRLENMTRLLFVFNMDTENFLAN